MGDIGHELALGPIRLYLLGDVPKDGHYPQKVTALRQDRGQVGMDDAVINLGTGMACSINQLWRSLQKLTGYARQEKHGVERKGDIRDMVFSNKRARELLGWHPAVPLEDGLYQTVNAFNSAA